jgi:hypothetical protein
MIEKGATHDSTKGAARIRRRRSCTPPRLSSTPPQTRFLFTRKTHKRRRLRTFDLTVRPLDTRLRSSAEHCRNVSEAQARRRQKNEAIKNLEDVREVGALMSDGERDIARVGLVHIACSTSLRAGVTPLGARRLH